MIKQTQQKGKRKDSKIFQKGQEPVHEHLHWDFPVEFPLHPGEHGLPEDFDQHSHDVDIESICGGIDESQPVEQYDGTLGVTVAFVNAHQAPVGNLQWNNNLAAIYTNPGNVSGVRWCTGTLIARDLFLSAGHCFDQTGGGWQRPMVNGTTNIITPAEIATNMHVNFNYQVDPAGNPRVEQQFPVVQLVEYRLGSLDFAIVRLGGNPGNTFGWTQISTTDAAAGDMLCIIQHPSGLPKRIDAGPAFHLHDTRVGYDSIDTLGGSSGSGILRASDGRLVGVHTNGGCSPAAGSHNHGVRITSIVSASPIIQGLTTFKLKFADDRVIVKPPLLDSPVLKRINDVKAIGFDVRPIDRFFGRFGFARRRGGAAPFILATPHHSMGWRGEQVGRDETLAQYEAQLAELQAALEEGTNELSDIEQQYRQVLAEYQALVGEGRQA